MNKQLNTLAALGPPRNDKRGVDALLAELTPERGAAHLDLAWSLRVLRALGAAGFLQHCVPGTATGLRNKLDLANALADIAPGMATMMLAQMNMPLWLLGTTGRHAVAHDYYAACLRAEQIGCIGVTEKEGGSDPLAHTATRVWLDGDEIVLDGEKEYVLNGPVADFAIVLARSQERKDMFGLTWVIVPLQHPGVRVEQMPFGALAPASFARLIFDQCRLPATHMVGQPHRGFLDFLPALLEERLTGAAVMLQVAQRTLQACIDHVRARPFDTTTLANASQVVRHRLADLHADLRIARCYLDDVCEIFFRGGTASQEQVAGVKLLAGQVAQRIVTQCAQLYGGRGFLRDFPIATLTLDVLAGQFFAGVPEAMRDIVARGLANRKAPPSTGIDTAFRSRIRTSIDTYIVPFLDRFECDAVTAPLFANMGAAGIFKTLVAREHGGDGCNFLQSAVIAEELMRHRAVGVGSSLMLQANTLCPVLSRFGSADIHARFLEPLMAGTAVGSFAVTEPGGGSALMTSIACRARLDGDEWVIDGEKMFITNAPIADTVVVLAITENAAGPFSMSLIAVPTATPGCSVTTLDKLGLSASPVGRLRFAGCRVPQANLVGTRGRGYLAMSDTMKEERLLIAIGSLAFAEACIGDTVRFLAQRQLSGKPLLQNASVRQELAQLRTELDASHCFVEGATQAAANGAVSLMDTSIAKFRVCDLVQKVVQRCVELHGSRGLVKGTWMERAYRDSRVLTVYGGTSDTMRELVAQRLFPRMPARVG